MGSIVKKKSGNKYYYSYIETKRVNGKVKMIKQAYLGSAEKVLQRLTKQQVPEQIKNYSFGLEAALFQCAKELKLEEILNKHSNGTNKNIDTGKILLGTIIMRCINPSSKNMISKMWDKTVLKELTGLSVKDMKVQRIWESMENIDDDSIEKIEKDLWKELLKVKDNCDDTEKRDKEILDVLLYDTTNFYSYLDERTKSELFKRGKNKQSRNNKRQVGLTIALDKEMGLPIYHELFAGNMNDASLFPGNMTKLINRMAFLNIKTEGVTIVMDRANNNRKIFKKLTGEGVRMHVVGALKGSTKTPLWQEEPKKRIQLDNGRVVFCKRGELDMGGLKLRAVVAVNPEKKKRDLIKLEDQIKTAQSKILKISSNYSNPKRRGKKSKLTPQEQSRDILKKYNLMNILEIEWNGDEVKAIKLKEKEYEIRRKRAGKSIFFTDRKDLTMKKIVQLYRGQYEVEHFFREIKNSAYIQFRPIFHWKDHFVKIHALLCVLAFILMKWLQKKLNKAGIRISLKVLQQELSDINYNLLMYGQEASIKILKKLSYRSSIQDEICRIAGVYELALKLEISP